MRHDRYSQRGQICYEVAMTPDRRRELLAFIARADQLVRMLMLS